MDRWYSKEELDALDVTLDMIADALDVPRKRVEKLIAAGRLAIPNPVTGGGETSSGFEVATGLDIRTTPRTGDAGRDKVIARIREAYARGELPREVFEARLAAALAAVTRGDLQRLLTDLEPLSPPPDTAQALATPPPRAQRSPADLRAYRARAVRLTAVYLWVVAWVVALTGPGPAADWASGAVVAGLGVWGVRAFRRRR
jgi:hypothetical protein